MMHLTRVIDRGLRTCFSDSLLKSWDTIIANGLLNGLLFFRIARLAKVVDKTTLPNRAGIFLEEAEKRGLEVYAIHLFGRLSNSYRLSYQGRTFDYHEIPLTMFSGDVSHYDAKNTCKTFLHMHQLPHAEGAGFKNKAPGRVYGLTLGFPLVVKPNDGSLSAHATYPIHDTASLDRAIDIAQRFQPEYIVERYVTGNLYRATVVGQTHVFVCQKVAPHVIGDGQKTIRELIKQKNTDPRRAAASVKSSTLHSILVDPASVHLDRVPAQQEKVFLSSKATLSAGCDIIACTSQMHEENKELFLRVARLLSTDLIGIDFIAQDIARPSTQQTTAILEINTLPYIDMHQNPSQGEPDPVAKIVWDIVLQKMDQFFSLTSR
ncbi:hypothetical protein FJZ48_04150 [Candidatus Uhrbacteria bacterium]|nr:hypothetical protein [Candidatus Uhrbacteria bacterium]